MHPQTPIRRTHSPEFKARVLAACRQPGASIAGVALAHGVNTNVVHKWLSGIGMKRCAQQLPAATPSPMSPMQFLPVGLSASSREHSVSPGSQDIHLDVGDPNSETTPTWTRWRKEATVGSYFMSH